MTQAETYEFDLNGVIVYPDLLPLDDVNKMNALIDADLKQKGKEDTHHFSFLELDPIFLDVMAHPRMLQIIRPMIGDWLRLDHAYGLQMDTTTIDRGLTRSNLHGGPRTDNGEHQYQWFDGKMYNGLIVVMFALEAVKAGDGGFICVPGSHKANIHYRPPFDSPLVANPAVPAGGMLIFTEALVHGTTTWASSTRRRSLLYKYSPGHSTWGAAESLDAIRLLAQTDLQRDLLRAPCVGGRKPILFPETG